MDQVREWTNDPMVMSTMWSNSGPIIRPYLLKYFKKIFCKSTHLVREWTSDLVVALKSEKIERA